MNMIDENNDDQNHCEDKTSSNANRIGVNKSLDEENEIIETTTKVDATLSSENASAAVEYARLCGKLKSTPRTGWVRRNVPNVESVADHSWRVAALTLLLYKKSEHEDSAVACSKEDLATSYQTKKDSFDISKCMEMAILHDLAESIVGDIAPSDNISKEEKQLMEEKAINQIAGVLGNVHANSTKDQITEAKNRLLATFHEYEERQTKEAIAVKDLDLLDMIIQADEYEQEHSHIDLTEFFVGTPVERFRNDIIRDVAREIHMQRNARVAKKEKDRTEKDIARTHLTNDDADFIESFANSSPMKLTSSQIETVVLALRKHDAEKYSKEC